jgi:hypothetical protein
MNSLFREEIKCLFWEEMNSVHYGKKRVMFIEGRNE